MRRGAPSGLGSAAQNLYLLRNGDGHATTPVAPMPLGATRGAVVVPFALVAAGLPRHRTRR